MHPGPHRKGRRFFPPIVQFTADEIEPVLPLILVGPTNEYGTFEFNGRVTLTPCIVERLGEWNYLFLLKEWSGGPERPEYAVRHIASPADFANEMRIQQLRVAIDKYGTGRVFRTRNRAAWERLVGTGGRAWEAEADRRARADGAGWAGGV